jgi:hypothetical protein
MALYTPAAKDDHDHEPSLSPDDALHQIPLQRFYGVLPSPNFRPSLRTSGATIRASEIEKSALAGSSKCSCGSANAASKFRQKVVPNHFVAVHLERAVFRAGTLSEQPAGSQEQRCDKD